MPLVAGLRAFRDALAGFEDCYALIGGGACSLLFDAAGTDFRLTRDLDVVILAGSGRDDFARAFWAFVRNNGYKTGGRNDERVRYYRFTLPEGGIGTGLPEMVELFARHPDFDLAREGVEVAPMPFDEGVSSLSAIILDDGYYDLIRSGVTIVEGIPVVDALHIIPLKMRAHIDLNDRHDRGERVNEKDLRKHRRDVLELAGLLADGDRLPLTGVIREDAERFLNGAESFAARTTNRKERDRRTDTVEFLRVVYLA